MSATTTSYFASILERADDNPSLNPIDTEPCEVSAPPTKRSNKVCGIIVRKGDYFLTVFGRRARVWSFPKGHVEAGETDWQCAIREFVEETGMYVQVVEPPRRFRLGKGVFYFFDNDTYNLLGTVNPQDTDEVGEVRWMSAQELGECEANRYIKLFLESQYPRLQPPKSLPYE
jgi:8-oxo-dGTP pyrophosphatase MutT (NUDIX family)